MSPSPQLAPAGSSIYSSNTMNVGDGTWDTQRNTFLLPNLVGLNFDTMRYNGMGNRFKEMGQYHNLIRGHGIVAAITFLGIVPTAILFARFYGRNPFWALRVHIWLQVLTLLLTTVLFILGFMAVGPKRSLTNPHHGIGVAIYVMIWAQFIGGWWMHKREKNRRRRRFPLKVMLHQWFGRTIALLGIVQIPLGLTLYGSPKSLFVLYALAGFALLFIYFVLTFLHKRRMGEVYERGGSYVSRSDVIEERPGRSRLGRLAAVGAAGVGLAALSNRFRHRSRSRSRSQSRSRVDVVGTESGTGSYVDEKHSERAGGGWGRRVMQIGALGGAAALAKRYFGRRDRDVDSDPSDLSPRPYRPAFGGNVSVTDDSMSRVEEGRPPPVVGHRAIPGAAMGAPLNRRRSNSSYSTHSSMTESGRGGHGLRNAVAGVGAFAALRHMFRGRRERKEQRRIDDLTQRDQEQERIARANSRRYTGDGGRRGSYTSTNLTGSVDGRRQGINSAVPVAGLAAAGALSDRDRMHNNNPTMQPPMAGIPPVPPMHHDSSGSEMYTSTGGRHHQRHHNHPVRDSAAAALAGGIVGHELGNRRRRSSGRQDEYADSPPVSVKVKMHNDGRHVTLRRLTEEEAAASREAKRRDRAHRSGSRRRRAGSTSSVSEGEASDRWRRAEALERQQAEEMRRQNAAAGQPPYAGPSTLANFPPPPPIPAGSIGSPGTITGTGTEASADYASNRKRRRAERAQAKQAREGRGQSVEFT